MAKYYVVAKGRKTGIFNTWAECEEQVKGFKSASFKSYHDLEEAKWALKNGLDIAKMLDSEVDEAYKLLEKQNIEIQPVNGICVDGACSGNPGTGEYRYVWTGGGMEIFRSKQYKNVTNNVMEFLGLVDAIKYALKHKISVIYTDSVTAMVWVKKKECNTTIDNKNPISKEINKAIEFLHSIDCKSVEIEKWDTKKYGDIPADFARK